MSSFPLTNSIIFQRGGSTTNQYTLHLKFGATKITKRIVAAAKASRVAGEAESFLPGTIGSSPTARRPGTMSANGWLKKHQKWVWWSFDMLTLVDTLIYFCSILLCWIFVLPNWKPFGGWKCTENNPIWFLFMQKLGFIRPILLRRLVWLWVASSFHKFQILFTSRYWLVVWNMFHCSIDWD